MSLVEPNASDTEVRLSSGLTLNLSSNNPFRNRAASPSHPSPSSPTLNFNGAPTDKPTTRNPFLDHTDEMEVQQMPLSPATKSLPRTNGGASSPTKTTQPTQPTLATAELFNNLSIGDNSTSNRQPQPMGPPRIFNRPTWVENVPPPAYSTSLGHRPSRSHEEEQERIRIGGKPRNPSQRLDIFADPPGTGKPREQRRPRRNSDGSVADRPRNSLDTDDERRRRERRHREREIRHRDGKGRPPPTASKSKKPNQRLDIIDKLDVTSIYGTGLFHHDGPFDACNPHRNRKGSQRAPMQAFPKNSANNVLGGSGPVNKNIDIAQFHGRGAEGFTDYSTSGTGNPAAEAVAFEPYVGPGVPIRADTRPGVDRGTSFNATARVEMVHGDESMGLGTSTFLEGAPAARVAIQRRESESEGQGFGGGLGRKRSLVQKIRGISTGKSGVGQRITSPEPAFETTTFPTEVQSAGGLSKIRETNPFFNEYDAAYDKKGAKITIAEEQDKGGPISPRVRAPSSPRRGLVAGGLLERRITNDGSNAGVGDSGEGGKIGGGFLNRVRSLRGGRRARPERRE